MSRDPFYRQILAGLAENLDPATFEHCAADLLRDEWPTLVPVPGGGDAGMDGAVGNAEGPPTILVCTTGADVIGNLRRSLQSHLDNGVGSRKAISVTSQELSAQRVKNLHKQASDLGFELLHVYQRQAIADRLYRSPRWCRELLNLAGEPPAISAVPLSTRPTSDRELVGREADLAWLRGTAGDRLIVGQPGSGKTSLLKVLVEDGLAGFLVDLDPGRIAAAIREQMPAVVIADDAHVDSTAIARLRQIRAEMGAEFDIVAASWPSEAERIQTALGIGDAGIHELSLLTRDEIVAVIRSAGLAGPDVLVEAVVDQALGRPGLAATLTHLCVAGAGRDVYLGEALNRDVRYLIQPAVGEKGIRLLACFALGGDAGVPMTTVSEAMQVPLLDVSTTISTLGYAGIVEERDRGNEIRIVVVPEALRHALVRDVFFNLPGHLDHRPLLDRMPSQVDAARTLVGSAACGARITGDTLRTVLDGADSVRAWEDYAWLGPGQAAWIVEHRPVLVPSIADAVLTNAPERALPVLFDYAKDDNRPLPQHPDHPLRRIESWVEAVTPGSNEGPLKRAQLLTAAANWQRTGGNNRVTTAAITLALSPNFEVGSTDPGAGTMYRWSRGPLAEAELREIAAAWPRALALIHEMGDADWPSVFGMVTEWASPGHTATRAVSQEVTDFMRSVAGTILRDIAAWPGNRAVAHRARELAENYGFDADDVTDDFDVLYPRRPHRRDTEWKAERERLSAAVRDLAARWSTEPPDDAAARIAAIEEEAQAAGLTAGGPRRTPELATELADRVAAVDPWLEALMVHRAPADIVAPFLRRAVTERSAHASELLHQAAAQPDLKRAAVWAVLSSSDASPDALHAVWELLPSTADLVYDAASRSLSDDLLGRLLGHPDNSVATYAALGEWSAEPRGTVRPVHAALWRSVIGRAPELDYELAEILKADAELAVDWIGNQLDSNAYLYAGSDDLLGEVLDGLNLDAKRTVLGMLRGHRSVFGNVVARLVGDDIALYRALLDDDHLQEFHLAPLEGHPTGGWRDRVIAAGERGYSAEAVAIAVLGWGHHWTGFESTMWDGWANAFAPFLSDGDPFVRNVSEAVIERVSKRRADALARERREAIRGRG